MLRTHTCGELDKTLVDKEVTLSGWADTVRNYGKLAFVDLRDRYGITQIVLSAKDIPDIDKLRNEDILKITGKVKNRLDGKENKDISTGDIEVKASSLKILSKSKDLPFEINKDIEVGEELRLKYRYLDLRKKDMMRNMKMRHDTILFLRNFLHKEKFLEITTPMLTKSTPEGARDYVVPSRLHKGKFYALPQSPQQYKQLLMCAGVDKYVQMAPCFRDEDARAHRAPGEFYQMDLEMSFVEQEDILELVEGLMIKMVEKLYPEKKITKVPFPRIKHADAIKKYKTDSPDIRKNKKDDNELGFCWIVDFPLFEKQTEEDFFHGAGKDLAPSHHMFTAPKEEDIKLLDKTPGKAKSYQHDMVLNGFEIGGGSIRIHDHELQEKIFDLIGFTKKQKKEFSHLLEAFSYGVPPHGGIAIGLDRLMMILLGKDTIREVIAFPKNKDARDPVMDAPADIEDYQLKELGIKLDKKNL